MTTISHTSKVKAVKKNFTADVIATYQCKAGKSQSIYWDAKTTGLGLRVTATGAKSYIFETSLNNKTIRITIGDIRTYSIKAAQVEATKLKAMTDSGIDPRQVKADQIANDEAKAQAKKDADATRILQDKHETLTLGVVWSLYIEARRKRWSEWSIRDHENIARVGGVKKIRGKGLTEDAPLASLLDVKLKDLTGVRIAEWLAKEAETRPTRAALAFRLLSGFINWCDSQVEYAGLVPSGACKARQVRDVLPSNNTKIGDSLQKEQLPAWFAAVKQINNPVISAYLQTVLLTGRRRRQVAELKWTDIDFQWNKITMNDKVEHTPSIPLTPYVAHILQSLPRRNQYVFSSPAAKAGFLAEPTDAHHKACVEAGVDLSLHGLRRSFANLSEWVDVPEGIAAQIQGHAPQGVRAKNYIRRPLDLLRMWHIKIEAWILEQANVKFEPLKAPLHIVSNS